MIRSSTDHLNGKTILITGAAGFIASRLATSLALKCPESQFLLCDKKEYFSRPYISELSKKSTIFDIFELLENFNEIKVKPDYIFHFGACSSTTETNKKIFKNFNFEYSQKLAQLAHKFSIPFIYASSASTYGDGSKGFSDETAFIPNYTPLNLYGQSKQDFDLWCLSNQDKIPKLCIGLKFFNVYGPGEDHKGAQASMVWHSFHQIIEKQQVNLFKSPNENYKDGQQERDFVFVDDCLDVAIFASQLKKQFTTLNVGTGKAQTWIDLVEASFNAMNIPAKINFIDMPEHIAAHYQYHTQAELSQLKNLGYHLNFRNLEEGAKLYFEDVRKRLPLKNKGENL